MPKTNPLDFNYDVPLDRSKLNVWIGLMGYGRIYKPVFFDGNVNGWSYLRMINNEVVPGLQQHVQLQQNGEFPRLWWSQDGAPAHRTHLVRDRLEQLFPRRVIGIGRSPSWMATKVSWLDAMWLFSVGLLESLCVLHSSCQRPGFGTSHKSWGHSFASQPCNDQTCGEAHDDNSTKVPGRWWWTCGRQSCLKLYQN